MVVMQCSSIETGLRKMLTALNMVGWCLLKAALQCRVKGVGNGGGGVRWRRFGEFCGNLNNYTLLSPRVINYICGKGFLILEPSSDKS